jgi:hypothetical protein
MPAINLDSALLVTFGTWTHQTLEDAFASRSAARHHEPNLILKLAELQPLLDFLWAHSYC